LGDTVAVGKLWRKAAGVSRAVRDLGWRNGCLYACARVVSCVSGDRVRIHKYYLVAQPVAATPWLAPHRGGGVQVRPIAEGDPVVERFPRPAWAAPYRFRQGAMCLGAFRGDAMVGFLWLTLGPYLEDEVRCRFVPLPEGTASWDFDVYVEPEQRHGIVFLRLWDEANRFLAARGVHWSLSRISAFNRGSMHSHARMGAKPIGAVIFLSLGRWQIAASSVAPRFHISTRADDLPTYALNPTVTLTS
jgi:hypothetical protein